MEIIKVKPQSAWQWPVNLLSYDRAKKLSSLEQEHIKILVDRFAAGGKAWHKEARIILERLLNPLHDVLNYIGVVNTIKRKNTICTTVIFLLIKAMHQHQISYWAFSIEIWYKLLGNDYYSYIKEHGVTANARQQLIAVAYLLCGFDKISNLGRVSPHALAVKIFTQHEVNFNINRILDALTEWGYTPTGNIVSVRCALSKALLLQRSPYIAELNYETLNKQYHTAKEKITRRGLVLLSYALVQMNIITHPLGRDDRVDLKENIKHRQATKDVPLFWLSICERWFSTSTLQQSSRISTLYRLFQAGRWFAKAYPHLQDVSDWTYEICTEFVAEVCRGKVGQWSNPTGNIFKNIGKPLSSRSKECLLKCVRNFISDCQDWGWIPRRFNPARTLATPRSLRAVIGPNPRVIDDAIWAKIVWAGLNLVDDDLLKESQKTVHDNWRFYPPEMIRALAIIWLFGGLRRNEIMRLRLGCIRWQHNNENRIEHSKNEHKICLLDIPVNKTNVAFTKPVDAIVGTFITAWEKVRPPQPSWLDQKTGERIQFLFSHRGRKIGTTYINKTLIPLLCNKAGVPLSDARGRITSHRARATIASQLYNAKEPLTLFELQDWLGHRSPESTRHYTQISPTVLAKSYADAGYFARNVRAIEVLIDQEAIKGNRAATEPWKYYDLGHGYCTYDFFEQCQHRMTCARCDFYVPKESSKAQLLEGKQNLLRLKHEIPLTDEETAAVDDGVLAYEKLINKLADTPTPSGSTPREILTSHSDNVD